MGRRKAMNRAERRRETIAATLVAIGLCTGVWLLDHSPQEALPPQPSPEQAVRPAERPGAGAERDSVAPLPPAAPVRIRIPEIRVDAAVMPLGLEPDGGLEVPPQDAENLTGWYEGGVTPGARGTAIIAGHVDSETGPSVFYGLGALERGNTVAVDRADGLTATFEIDAIEVYSREDFPDDRVYGPAEGAEIRLITCGGGYSSTEGYLGNVVVYGHLTEIAATPGSGPEGRVETAARRSG
ncbi:class F sortase [Streptomyces sp. WMMC897]|uniref:class F sortase n=1 Tax=Streptomyces sp. WMMC897 TaxID=3014782 RepID=UPI0022B6F418|nr:class F sortase [Streptomyces sp. WMMC897]MCZ7413594.1 class F sortase [Streptomyces sp. WMMC897]